MDRLQTGKRSQMDGKHGKYMVVLYTKPEDCGGNCLYCIKSTTVTRSTLPNEDTLMARCSGWSSTEQFLRRCEDSNVRLNTGNKFELRIKGNSFTNYDPAYLEGFIKDIYDLLNGCIGENLEDSFRRQEYAADKCVQIVVETRPDLITDEWCQQMLKWGVRTVEIGVQSLDDEVLALNNRGHGTEEVRRATELIRGYGFELGYQVMLGLYGSSEERDLDMIANRLWVPEYYPDSLKIYPCLLLGDEAAQKPLYELYHSGKWKPLDDARYHPMLEKMLPGIPWDTHVNRLQRLFEPEEVSHGVREVIDRKKYRGICKSMWQRSLHNTDRLNTPKEAYTIVPYLRDHELCVQAILPDQTLLGYARLSLRETYSIIRDLRVWGAPLKIGEQSDAVDAVQHKGIGKALLAYMEQYSRDCGLPKICVNSSAGCVGYFRKNGYVNETYYRLSKACAEKTENSI